MTKMKNIFFPVLTFVASVPASTDAFFIIPQHTVTASTATTSVLHFGLPNFGPKESSSDELTPKKGKKSRKKNATAEEPLPEAKIGLGSLIQLITAGMGSPFLGDFEGVEEGTGKLMFSLEANNLVDEVSQLIFVAPFKLTILSCSSAISIFTTSIPRTGKASRPRCPTLKTDG